MFHSKIESDCAARKVAHDNYRINESSQNELLKIHGGLVRRIAWHVFSRMSKSIELEDLMQIGLIALLDAARVYQDRGFAFTTYATTRIRGAMIDQLRKEAKISRSALQNRRKLNDTRTALERTLLRAPNETEMAQAMNVDIAAYYELVSSSASIECDSIDDLYTDHDMWFADTEESADTRIERQELKQLLADNIASLPEREAMVLQLFFVEELNLNEIGEVLNVGAARVCQLKKSALQKLRELIELAI